MAFSVENATDFSNFVALFAMLLFCQFSKRLKWTNYLTDFNQCFGWFQTIFRLISNNVSADLKRFFRWILVESVHEICVWIGAVWCSLVSFIHTGEIALWHSKQKQRMFFLQWVTFKIVFSSHWLFGMLMISGIFLKGIFGLVTLDFFGGSVYVQHSSCVFSESASLAFDVILKWL